MFRLSNNTDLPEASAFGVKSFWLLLITVVLQACNMLGINLLPGFCEVGLGCTAEELATKGETAAGLIQQLVPILTAVWLWFERRAPNLRLVFWRKGGGDSALRFLGAFAILALVTVSAGSQALASPLCGDAGDFRDQLTRGYREEVIGGGVTQGVATLIYVNPETGTWTVLQVLGDRACVIAAGNDWTSTLPGAPA